MAYKIAIFIYLALTATFVTFGYASPPTDGIDREISAVFDSLQKTYRKLHAHPELAGKEKWTATYLAKQLKGGGAKVLTGVGGFGVVAILKNGPGKTAMVVAEMDALPIQEDTGWDFSSSKDQVMHACGHDLHMAVLVGVARVMRRLRQQWQGSLVLIGQPANETNDGARAMIQDRLFERIPKPDLALHLHSDSSSSVGEFSYTEGFTGAFFDSADITFTRKASDKFFDPLLVTTEITTRLSKWARDNKIHKRNMRISVAAISGGSRHHSIATSSTLHVVARSFEEPHQQELKQIIRKISAKVAKEQNAPTPTIAFYPQLPPVFNEPKLIRELLPRLHRRFGAKNVIPGKRNMGWTDFGLYSKEGGFPALSFAFGVQSATAEERYYLHSERFSPDWQNAIKTGVAALADSLVYLLRKDFFETR